MTHPPIGGCRELPQHALATMPVSIHRVHCTAQLGAANPYHGPSSLTTPPAPSATAQSDCAYFLGKCFK